jgi:hypothetical protein
MLETDTFNPHDWLWSADDGRIYSSAQGGLVSADDPRVVAWASAGRLPTRWPRDDAGTQTVAALQMVLDDYGLFADLAGYAAAKRYAVETGGITVAGARIATDRVSQAMIGNAFAYVQASGAATVSYKTDGGFVTLSADQIKVVALAVGAHVQACFAAEDAVDAGIHATPPTITTGAQVDAAFASLTSA